MTSGTGSVTMRWLEATRTRRRIGPHARQRAARREDRVPCADAGARGLHADAASPCPRTLRTRACSWTATPRSMSRRRSPSARRPGCTIAPSGAKTPRRKTGEAQCSRTWPGLRSRSRSATPSSAAASIAARPTSSCAGRRGDAQLAAAPVPGVDVLLLAPAADGLRALLRRRREGERGTGAEPRRAAHRSPSQKPWQKPPLRPLGPCPQRSASRRTTFASGACSRTCHAHHIPV